MSSETTNKESIGEFPFSVRARVAMQLGRESISDSVVAILELVKNSYDADAENVHIYFLNQKSQPSNNNDSQIASPDSLVIEDDGLGMTKSQVIDSWMVIGSDNKAVNRRSSKNRAFIGEKGLGRLGLDRLCQSTSIQTFVQEDTKGIELVIDWRKYEANKARLEEVKHSIYAVSSKFLLHPLTKELYEKGHGTRLSLESLKDTWDQEAIGKLRQQLSLLVSPFAGINDFSICVHSEWFNDPEIRSEEMKEVAEWSLHSELYENENLLGEKEWHISHKMISRDKKTEYNYDASWSKSLPKRKGKPPQCGQLTFEMYFLPRQSIEELDFAVTKIRDFMDSNQGIRIYRDNFRVKPYGEPTGEGDWLNLSLNRVRHPTSRGKRGWRVAYNQVFGAVFIERERNQSLLDQTNREGLVVGPAYDDLVQYVRHAIEWFERRDIDYFSENAKLKKEEKAREEAKETSEAAKQAVEEFRETITDALTLINSVDKPEVPETKQILEKLQTVYDRVNNRVEEARVAQEEMGRLYAERVEELQREKDTLANLASLGIMAVAFGHETLNHTFSVTANSSILKKRLPSILESSDKQIHEEIIQCVDDIHHAAQRINTFARFTLDNVRRDKRKEVKIYLNKLIQDLLGVFMLSLEEKRNIKVIREIQEIEPIRGFIIDWESIIINFISNAIWALEDTPSGSRLIRIRLFTKDNAVHLSFADSGCGIAKDTIDRIFDPTFTTKKDRQGRTTGTGMGLYIIDNLVKSYGGTIRAESPSDLGGAQFLIRVPYRLDNRGN